jgi:hypothetical protein
MKLFPGGWAARPESNRGALRDVLLEALAERGNTTVHYERGVGDIREVLSGSSSDGSSSMAELFDREGNSLGEFDLVVDSMGLHSTLRAHRVHDAVGKHFAGQVMLHGVIEDVEATCELALAKRFARHGTINAFGRGYVSRPQPSPPLRAL